MGRFLQNRERGRKDVNRLVECRKHMALDKLIVNRHDCLVQTCCGGVHPEALIATQLLRIIRLFIHSESTLAFDPILCEVLAIYPAEMRMLHPVDERLCKIHPCTERSIVPHPGRRCLSNGSGSVFPAVRMFLRKASCRSSIDRVLAHPTGSADGRRARLTPPHSAVRARTLSRLSAVFLASSPLIKRSSLHNCAEIQASTFGK